MPRLRVFVSSTYYDLRYIRSSLEGFITQLDYEAVLSEKGKIAYDPDIPLDESCYREAATADILVLIIGGRYGSASSGEAQEGIPDFFERYESITKKEYDAANSRDIPIYVLVEKSVFSEYLTYRKNKNNNTIEYAHVDSVNIFSLIEEILSKVRNNPVYQFDHYDEIEAWLKGQWSGLFRELINRRADQKQLTSLSDRINELSSINNSLQRYMEEVVSKVSDSPEEANNLIQAENERLLNEKRNREIDKIFVFYELFELYDLTREQVKEIYRDATSISDLCRRIGETSDKLDENTLLEHWGNNPNIVDSINKVRILMDRPELEW